MEAPGFLPRKVHLCTYTQILHWKVCRLKIQGSRKGYGDRWVAEHSCVAACAGGSVFRGDGRDQVRWAGWRRSKSILQGDCEETVSVPVLGRGGCGSYLKEKAEQALTVTPEADPRSAELGHNRKGRLGLSTERNFQHFSSVADEGVANESGWEWGSEGSWVGCRLGWGYGAHGAWHGSHPG